MCRNAPDSPDPTGAALSLCLTGLLEYQVSVPSLHKGRRDLNPKSESLSQKGEARASRFDCQFPPTACGTGGGSPSSVQVYVRTRDVPDAPPPRQACRGGGVEPPRGGVGGVECRGHPRHRCWPTPACRLGPEDRDDNGEVGVCRPAGPPPHGRHGCHGGVRDEPQGGVTGHAAPATAPRLRAR